MTRDELIRWVGERFAVDAEHPWGDESYVLRHPGNRRWFAVGLRVPYARLGIGREGSAEIVDVKCGPLLMDAYRRQPGILPGYHMNKDHWITVLLDGTAADETVRELMELSFALTDSAAAPKRRAARLKVWDGLPVRVTDTQGRIFEGEASFCPAEYCLHAFGREEDALQLGQYVLYKGDIRRTEPLPPEALCGFYGAEGASPELRELYRRLKRLWQADTCAPRMRADWSPENPSLGQCSITAFLVQERFGGEVAGIPLGDGNVHCFNRIDGEDFDLTSEQFGDREQDYERAVPQKRETHFGKTEKLERYRLLKRRLEEAGK